MDRCAVSTDIGSSIQPDGSGDFEIWSPYPDFDGGFTGLYVDEGFFSEFCMRCAEKNPDGRFIGRSVADIWDGALFHVDRGLENDRVGDLIINPAFKIIAMNRSIREVFEL